MRPTSAPQRRVPKLRSVCVDLRPVTHALTVMPRPKSSSQGSRGDFSGPNTLRSASASSVQSVADESLSLVDIERLFSERVEDRKDDLMAAFETFDQEGNKTVTRGEFRRVIEGFLVPLTESQFEGLLAKLEIRENGTIAYMEFLGKYCSVVSHRIPLTSARHRNWSIGELQCHLKKKIGGNLKNVTRAFRLFDYNSDGQIQQHELRRVLENYCFPMSQPEFHRLWSHYSPNNTKTISYKEFLEKLGVDCGNCKKIEPDSTKLALNWDASSQTTRPKSNTSVGTFPDKFIDTLDEVQTRFLSKMKKNYNLVEKALEAFDSRESGLVSREDLRSVFSHFLFPMDDNTFSGLLNRFGVSSSEPVKWRRFLSLFKDENQTSAMQKISPPQTPDVNVTAEILSKLRQQILDHQVCLTDAFLNVDKNRTGVVSREDLRRVLENSLHLTDDQFEVLTDLLHAEDMDATNYQQFLDFFLQQRPMQTPKLNEQTTAQVNISTPAQNTEEKTEMTTMLSAEQCLSQLKKKIEEHHGDALTAFRLMDKNRDGLVNRSDLRVLFDSLMFVTKESEFQRFLELLGLTPGATLNYTEFCEKVHSSTRMRPHQHNVLRDEWVHNVCDQIHEYLVTLAHKRSSDFSQVFCTFGEDGKKIMTRNDLKRLLFKYYLPITSKEFEKLWGRYDAEGRGFLTQTEFLRQLQVTSDAADRLVSMTTPESEVILQNLRKWIRSDFEKVSRSLEVLDENRDGHVTMTDLLSVLHRSGFQLQESQLKHLLDLLGFEGCLKKLSYFEFLKRLAGSPETVENTEKLSPERDEQPVEEMVNTFSDILYKAFSAFDKTGDGLISPAEFHQVLDHFCIRLSEVQFTNLLHKLTVKDGEEMMINWREFLQICSCHKTESADEWLKTVQKMRFPNQTRPVLISQVQRRIQEVVSARLHTITRDMAELDCANTNTISQEDFRNICDHHCMRLNDDQFQNLWKTLPVNSFGLLEYREFLKKFSGEPKGLEKVGRSLPCSARPSLERPASLRRPKTAPCTFQRPSAPSDLVRRSSTSSRGITPLLNCEDVEMMVRPKVQERWRNIQRRCREVDTERSGEIDVETFLEILRGLRIDLSPADFERLALKYDIRNNGRLSYPNFLRHFVLMFGPQVNTANSRLKLHPPRTPISAGLLSAQCVEAMLRISSPVRLYWRQMRQRFVAFDPERSGRISLTDFRKVLRQFCVNLSEEEFFHFTSFFDKNISGKISYNDFLRIFLK